MTIQRHLRDMTLGGSWAAACLNTPAVENLWKSLSLQCRRDPQATLARRCEPGEAYGNERRHDPPDILARPRRAMADTPAADPTPITSTHLTAPSATPCAYAPPTPCLYTAARLEVGYHVPMRAHGTSQKSLIFQSDIAILITNKRKPNPR